jgi:vacuolar-type H+-ATPase subunit D/Vma8
MVENTVIANEEYQKAMFQYLELKKQLGMLQAGKDAIEQKKDMLISLGANYRAEASSNPSILMDAARERARKAVASKKAENTPLESYIDPIDNIPKRKMPVGKKPA